MARRLDTKDQYGAYHAPHAPSGEFPLYETPAKPLDEAGEPLRTAKRGFAQRVLSRLLGHEEREARKYTRRGWRFPEMEGPDLTVEIFPGEHEFWDTLYEKSIDDIFEEVLGPDKVDTKEKE